MYYLSVIPAALIFFLVRPKAPTKLDNAIFILANISVVLMTGSFYFGRRAPGGLWDSIAVPAILTYLICLLLLCIRLFGENQNQTQFRAQTAGVFKKVALYLLLPGFILTVGAVIVALYLSKN